MDAIYVLRLINGDEVIGNLMGENDKGIDLDNTLLIKYRIDDKGYPTIYFTKYCLLNKEFQVFFKRDTIMNVFRDPTPEVCQYYSNSLNKIKRAMFNDYGEEKPEAEDFDAETLLAIFERLSSNTTIQ